MKAIPIDEFLESVEELRAPEEKRLGAPAAGDWGRLVSEGRAARQAADGGRWRIGRLAGLVEKRYRTGALQRYSEEIGESYATVRRYRWVVSHYDADARFRFPSLSFSHFQAVAGLQDRDAWLGRAEKGGWSVDELTLRSHVAQPQSDPKSLDRARTTVQGLRRSLAELSSLVGTDMPAEQRKWLAQALAGLASEIDELQTALKAERTARRPSAARR